MTGLFDLSGRLAVVTGARRGIGRAMAEALAEAGADIIGVSASMEAEGSVLERHVRACGREFTGLAADLGNPQDVRRLACEQMGGAFELDLPLAVDAGIGPDWLTAK